jgi:hypothetical protein
VLHTLPKIEGAACGTGLAIDNGKSLRYNDLGGFVMDLTKTPAIPLLVFSYT